MTLSKTVELCNRVCKGVMPYSDPGRQEIAYNYCSLALKRCFEEYEANDKTLLDVLEEVLEEFKNKIYGDGNYDDCN